MNESRRAVELPLHLLDPGRLLGGANTLTAAAVREQTAMPAELADWWAKAVAARAPATPVLMDLETGEAIPALPGDAGVYGPVHVPYHDFRVFLARHEEVQ